MPTMVEELRTRLIDSQTGFFGWWNRQDRLDIYQSGLGWPLVTTVIDGFGIAASWQQDVGKRKSETLFRALKERLQPRLLEEFTANPADEGGASFLGLFAGELDDMVLFTYAPDEFLRISLLGRMKSAVPRALAPGRTG
jgi:hypothetical protein